jgi:hypothetical protein
MRWRAYVARAAAMAACARRRDPMISRPVSARVRVACRRGSTAWGGDVTVHRTAAVTPPSHGGRAC